MDSGDLIFYGIIAVSIVSSILKAVRKKPEEMKDTGMPDFKGSRTGDLFKSILQELEEKDDEFIPSNPKPAPPITSQVNKPKEKQIKRQDMASAMPRREPFNAKTTAETVSVSENLSDPILQTLDLQKMDELKKAIIYSEIIRPKF
ncbi:MAG: hypothetical protein VB110_06350 [Bacteroidales bacterium]|nr:hypothetical protein [Bacteroidales bacterium]